MRHHNSVFHDLVKRVPWAKFDRLVVAHKADHRIRRLSTKSQFLALLYGQLAGAVSLRDVEEALCQIVDSRPQVVSLNPNCLADVWTDIRAVGRALNVPERGEALVGRLLSRMHAVAGRARGRARCWSSIFWAFSRLEPFGGKG